MKRYKWLELIVRQPSSEEEAVIFFTDKAVNQYNLILLGKPEIFWQGNLFDKKPDAIVRCRVSHK